VDLSEKLEVDRENCIIKNFLGCLTQKMEALYSSKNFRNYLPTDKG